MTRNLFSNTGKLAPLSGMSRITIGPMFTRSNGLLVLSNSIEHTGWRLELAGDELAAHLEVYRKKDPARTGEFWLSDYYVPVDHLPFTVAYRPIDVANLETGMFLRLETVLASLYRKHDVARPLTSLLTEMRDCLPIQDFVWKRRTDGASLVSPVLRAAGFEITNLFCYGTGLTVSFGWVFPQDRSNSVSKAMIHAAAVEFRPRPNRTLGPGKWGMPLDTSLMYLMGKQLVSLVRRKPERCLSEKGVEVALQEFKWTKVSLLTREELTRARLEFIREHPELHDKPREMARALLAAELWSDTTQLSVVTKQVPKLILQTTNGETQRRGESM